jgi:GR25 family glycosyltransferase involved in LPS biosynthesis
MIPIVVISLRRANDRRQAIERNFAGLGIPFSFFDGVDARTMSATETVALDPRPYVGHKNRPLSPGEIAVAISFQRVLEHFCAGEEPFICVTEDDASILPEAGEYLDPARLRGLPDFDILRLANDPKRARGLTRVVTTDGVHAIHAPLRTGFFMLGQVFSRAGAQKALAGMAPLWAPLDNLLYRDAGIVGLRVLEVRPAVVIPNEEHSRRSTLDTNYAAPPSGNAWRTLAIVTRRKWFLLMRRWRAVRSYFLAWGLSGLLRLRLR